VVEAITANTVNVGVGLILLLAGGAMRAGDFTIGDFALFVYYLDWVSYFVQSVGSLWAQTRLTGVAVERLGALTPGMPGGSLVAPRPLGLRGPLPPPSTPVSRATDRLERLEVRDLGYRYPDSGRGVAGVSFTIERGQTIVVTGRVGVGKTTLLRALLGLLPRGEGEVRWNDRPVDDLAAWFVPPRAAYTPQTPRLFSEPLRENILLGLPEAAVDLPGAVRLAVLEPDVAALPEGLATPVGPRGVRLSGGQVLRAATARMLVRALGVIVIDDLSSALDATTERQVWERLFARPDTTALIVSHRRAALERADQIIVLQEGRVAAIGDATTLLATSPEFRGLWQADLDEEEHAV
jgi:ATP-binding cassette, subfamily B, bacterial